MNVDLANISGKAGKELGSFGMMMDQFAQMIPYLSVTELTKEILDKTGYKQEFDQSEQSGITIPAGELGRVLNSDPRILTNALRHKMKMMPMRQKKN